MSARFRQSPTLVAPRRSHCTTAPVDRWHPGVTVARSSHCGTQAAGTKRATLREAAVELSGLPAHSEPGPETCRRPVHTPGAGPRFPFPAESIGKRGVTVSGFPIPAGVIMIGKRGFQGTEPPIPIPVPIPDLPGIGGGGPTPDLPGTRIGGRSPGVRPHHHPRLGFAGDRGSIPIRVPTPDLPLRIGDQAELVPFSTAKVDPKGQIAQAPEGPSACHASASSLLSMLTAQFPLIPGRGTPDPHPRPHPSPRPHPRFAGDRGWGPTPIQVCRGSGVHPHSRPQRGPGHCTH
jgi:hypothetical protein